MKNKLFKQLLAFVLAFAMIISGITISDNLSMASDDTTVDEDDSGLTGDPSEGDIVVDTDTEEKTPLREITNLWVEGKDGLINNNSLDAVFNGAAYLEFYTSGTIEIDVKVGDTITFGPMLGDMRTNSNPYIAFGYNEAGKYISSSQIFTYGTKNNCVEGETIFGNLKIYTFTATKDMPKIRLSTMNSLSDVMVVTKNHEFTAEEYFAYMDSNNIDVDFLRPTNTQQDYVNLFTEENVQVGRSNLGTIDVTATDDCSIVLDDVVKGDVIYTIGPKDADSYFLDIVKSTEINAQISYGSSKMVPVYAELDDDYAIYAYKVPSNVTKVGVVLPAAKYEAGEVLVTKNQPFTEWGYRTALGMEINLYDAAKGAPGFINYSDVDGANRTEASTGNEFWSDWYTSDKIAVTPGDVITIGPVFIDITNYFGVVYNESTGSYKKPRIGSVDNALTEVDTVLNNAKIYSYTVPEGANYLRISMPTHMWDCTMITRNFEFTADEYFAEMEKQGVDVSFLKPTDTEEELVNLFPALSDETLRGKVSKGVYSNNYYTRSRIYEVGEGKDLQVGDTLYIAPANKSQDYHISYVLEDGGTNNIRISEIPIYEEIERGYAIYSYKVGYGIKQIAVVLGTGDYDMGITLVTKNQPFTGERYRELFGIDLDEDILDETSPLYGLKGLFIGDSISRGGHDYLSYLDHSRENQYRLAWAGGLAAHTGLISTNASVSGARMSEAVDETKSWIPSQAEPYYEEQYDLVVVQGGVNDASALRDVGEPLPVTATTEELYEARRTFIGGLQYAFHSIRENFPTATIFYIATFKTANTSGNRGQMEMYYDPAEELCETYNVHFIDLWNNDKLTEELELDTLKYLEDGLHPNRPGYDVIEPYIRTELERVMGSYESACDTTCGCGCDFVREVTASHDFAEMKTDANYHWNSCKLCSAMDENGKSVHTFGEWTVEGNTYTRSCSCGYVDTMPVDENGAGLTFLGGSLRMDYADYDRTSLRFGYRIKLPEGATLDSWSWSYTTVNPNNGLKAEGINKVENSDGTIDANLVITGVPSNYFDLGITAKMKIVYTLEGTVYTLEETVTRERSVNDVANSILESATATQEEKDYANLILQ